MNDASNPGQPVLLFAEQCDRGRQREENQDSILHSSIALGELMIVADGIGGYKGGLTASRMVIDGFDGYLKTLPQSYPPGLAIREAAAQTNSSIVAAANAPDSLHRHMGSTVVLALVQQSALGTQAWIGHIGDSRAYLVRDGRISRITHDHSAVQVLLDRNLITPEEAFHHPDASVLTRSLGHRAEVDIDVKQVSLQAGDSLLLCSDGLWGYVPGEAIEAVAIAPDFTVEAAAKALLELALDAGGHDNIGIELARLSSPAGATVLDM